MVCEVICYRGKSALREAARSSASRSSRSIGSRRRSSLTIPSTANSGRLAEVGFDPRRRASPARLADRRRASRVSPAPVDPRRRLRPLGAPLDEVAPVEPATMQDRTVIPWDKDDIDTLGFFKVDVLGLGMLTAIRKASSSFTTTGARRSSALRSHRRPRRRSRPKTAASTTPSATPTPSASSRSRAARRWRCCRASSRASSTTS